MNDKTLRRLTRGAGVLVVLVVLWAIQVVRPDFYTTMLSLTVEGDINGMTAYMASFGYKAIFSILISWAGEVIGIEISFHLTRTLFRGQAQRFIGGSDMFGKLDSYSCIRTIMAGRAIPYAPNVVVTALGALSHISYRDHFIANVIGKFPAVVIEVWLGHDLLLIREHWQRLLAVSAIVALVYGILWWRRKHGNS